MQFLFTLSFLLSTCGAGALSSRRAVMRGLASLAPLSLAPRPEAAVASGVSLEEAAKNAAKYRTKPVCTPQQPSACTDRYNKILDPRAGLTKDELAARDARNEIELEKLRKML
ncbi:hypothetical protein M885DRAFT_514254 [Pelagophyceae sp. CCMP2097]|nr:hypothetical protein M885DRAFT_514254 [Pelagophyceae sp. CCMP2097]|mmetsp:Transcript_11719/g.41356  ORF Transcript_11719/g.41356 Transcript_11719/m.41356 type:complete len:113 (-) Transcript_11719:3233-3571(-)